MTPETFNTWLVQAALTICVLGGLSVLVVSTRAGWIRKAVTWATVAFGCVGAMMILSPRWTKLAFEWNDFKAEIARLEQENQALSIANEQYASQIAKVSSLASAQFKSAEDFVATIRQTRDAVTWADFLPSEHNSYRVEVPTSDPKIGKTIAEILKANPDNATKALGAAGFKLLQPATEQDLKDSPVDALWVTPKGTR